MEEGIGDMFFGKRKLKGKENVFGWERFIVK
jgi:hypothetical protein